MWPSSREGAPKPLAGLIVLREGPKGRGPQGRGAWRGRKGPHGGLAPRLRSNRRGAPEPWTRTSGTHGRRPGRQAQRRRPCLRRTDWRKERKRRTGGRRLTTATGPGCCWAWTPWWQPPSTSGTCLASARWALSPPWPPHPPAPRPRPPAQGSPASPCSASWPTWTSSLRRVSQPCQVSTARRPSLPQGPGANLQAWAQVSGPDSRPHSVAHSCPLPAGNQGQVPTLCHPQPSCRLGHGSRAMALGLASEEGPLGSTCCWEGGGAGLKWLNWGPTARGGRAVSPVGPPSAFPHRGLRSCSLGCAG